MFDTEDFNFKYRIKNAPGVRPSKKYIEVKCYKPYEPQPILQLILSKEVETGTNFATLKDCQDIILWLVSIELYLFIFNRCL